MSEPPATIRDFDPSRESDWEDWVRLHNAVYPEHRTTVKEAKESDERRDPRCIKVRRFAVASGGEAVGLYGCGQIPWIYHPHRYGAEALVHPDHRRRGIGAALYDHLLADATARGAEALLAHAREDDPVSVHFALSRGFVERMREWESRLDVAAFDPAPWETARQRPAQHGIVLRSLAELADDPDRDRKVWELESESGADVPSTDPYTPLPYETYRRMVLEGPDLLPEGFIVAVDEATGKYVGSSNVWKREADADLQTGLTAVLRDYRRMGIALAMKLRVIDYARRIGSPCIRTENATTNRPMLSINEALGFVKQPAWILMTKELKEPSPPSPLPPRERGVQ